MMISLKFERSFWNRGIHAVAGIDEAGRGPLAGPVVSAAVIFDPSVGGIDGICDSKKLTENAREELFESIREKASSIGVGVVDNRVIDEINILNATFRSMHDAVNKLQPHPQHLLVDGPYFAGANIPFTTIVNGDNKCFSIAAASIIAKVTRDRLMKEYDQQFPQYGFAKNKGYVTKEHLDAIRKYGTCKIHRLSFNMRITELK